MKFTVQETPNFIMGIVFNPAYSFWIAFGWVEFQIVFKAEKSILETLPQMDMSPCKDCGAEEFMSANTHPEGGFHQCNNCTEFVPVRKAKK